MTDENQSQALANRPESPTLVTVEIDGKRFHIPAGEIAVARLKSIGGIAPADDLNVVLPSGRLDPLPDDGVVQVHAGMKFISTPRSGGAS